MSTATAPAKLVGWRTPAVLIACGCVIAVISFGPRSSLGFFLTPLSERQRLGPRRVRPRARHSKSALGSGPAVCRRHSRQVRRAAGAQCRCDALCGRHYLMAHSNTPGMLYISAGVLIGFGLSGCAMPAIIGALGKLVPENWRSFAFGAGTAAGSFGQFLYSPIAVGLMDSYGWQTTLLIFACLLLLIVPLSLTLMPPPRGGLRRPALPRPPNR